MSEKNKENTKNPSSLKENHIKTIKQRLVSAKQDFEKDHNLELLSFNRLHKLLEKEFGKNDIPSIPTLTSIFDMSTVTSNITITYLVQLCKLFNKSLSYMLSFPEENNNSSFGASMSYGSDSIAITDPHYLGDFKCYMLKSAHAPEDSRGIKKTDTLRDIDTIVSADLSISYINNVSTAKMIIHNSRREYNNEQQDYDIVLTGSATLLNSTKNIILNLVSAHNRPYTIMFDYETFDTGPAYFREAAVLSNSGGKRKLPQFYKMIIVRKEIAVKDFDYMRGLLSLNVNHVIISKDKLDEIKSKNELVQQFYEEYKNYLSLQERPFYVIPESMHKFNLNSSMNFDSYKRALLILRNHSYSLAQLDIGDDEKACDIAKALQQFELPLENE